MWAIPGRVPAGNWGQLFEDSKHLLSGIARERTEQNLEPMFIDSNNITDLLDGPFPRTVQEKARRLLKSLARKTTFPGETVQVLVPRDNPFGYCKTDEEMKFFLSHLTEQGWIQRRDNAGPGKAGAPRVITPKGWAYLDTAPKDDLTNPKVFVAMKFGARLKAAYDIGIKPAIEEAGYKAVRIDEVEHTDLIDDRIIAEIRECRFLVADLTTQNQGVYYESGFARGLGKLVILTCRKADAKNVHFDSEHYNQIRWEKYGDLKEKLKARILANVGRGPLRSDTK